MKSSKHSLVHSLLAIKLFLSYYNYPVENSQKATVNFYFNPRFSMKPSKFSIYFAKDCP